MNEFLRCVLESNPFAHSVVSEAADATVHAAAVHRNQFQELTACVEDVRRTGECQGRVVWGEAGVGKSHLLVQLDRWARREDIAFCPIVRHLDVNAGSQPWNIVKSVLRQMTRDYCSNCPMLGTSACPLVHVCACRSSKTSGEDHALASRPAHDGVSLAPWRQMPLFRLVRGAVEQALAELPERPSPYCAGQVLDAFQGLVNRQLQHLNGTGPDARAICDLLFRFFLAAQRNRERPGADRTAISMIKLLSGEPLDVSRAVQIGLSTPGPLQQSVSLSQVAAAQTVLLALAELARLSNRALVLCFDQVDELPPGQAGALARFLDPLVVHARNLLVVLSGQQGAMLDLVDRGVIGQAAWGRLNPDRSEILLGRIPSVQARQVLRARSRWFLEPFLTLPKVRRRVEQDPLFPLGSDWFAERVANRSDLSAREVLQLAHERWREQQSRLVQLGGPAWLEEGRGEGGEGIRESGHAKTRRRGDTQTGERESEREGVGQNGRCGGTEARSQGDAEKRVGAGLRSSHENDRKSPPLPLSHFPTLSRSTSPARRVSRLQEIAGWSTSAVLVVAIVLVLWARTNRLMESGVPSKAAAVGWDKRSAGPPQVGTSQGGTALALSDPANPTTPAAASPQRPEKALAGKKPPAIKDDGDSGDDSQGDADAVEPAPPPTNPPKLVARTQILAAPAAANPAPAVAARGPPSRGTRNVGHVSNVPVTQRHVGNAPHNPGPLVPPAPLASSAGSGRPAAVSVAASAADKTPTPGVAPADALAQSQPFASANARRRAARFGQTAATTAASRTGAADTLAAQSPVKPLAVSASPDVERLLDQAWGLIERGDLGPGRTRLLTARKEDPNDPRADFSLGLLDALTKQDWESAAKHFGDCLRRDRENVPTLNNLAVVLVQDKREGEAAKHWKAIVSQRPATAEVVQNVGVVRHLMDEGMIRKNNSLRQSLEHLYTEAAVATSSTCHPQAGFRFMTLVLTDGRTVGFSSAKKMQLAAWSPAPEASAPVRPAGPQPAARNPGVPTADPRVNPTTPSVPQGVPAANARQMPAANVFPNPAANFPFVPRPGYRYPRR